MTLTALILLQFTDPFRVGLLVALFVTMLRTRATTGVWLPLAAGAVWVAVVGPLTMQSEVLAPMMTVIVAGIVANILWLAIILAAWMLYQRFKAQG